MTPHPIRSMTGLPQGLGWNRTGALCLGLFGSCLPSRRPSRPKHPRPPLSSGARLSEYEAGHPWPGPPFPWHQAPGPPRGIGTRVTDSDGRFLFRSVPRGATGSSSDPLGYRELQDTLPVEPDSDLDLQLPMSVSPIELEPLVVVSDGERPLGSSRDFQQRRRTRSGTFFDREDIEERQPMTLQRPVPNGARGQSRARWTVRHTVMLQGRMPARLYGWMECGSGPRRGWTTSPVTMDLEAVEVYHGVNLPVEFGSNSCGAIVVWTREGGGTHLREGSFWRGSPWPRLCSLLALIVYPADFRFLLRG